MVTISQPMRRAAGSPTSSAPTIANEGPTTASGLGEELRT